MDPITLGLVALGAGALVAMVFFLIASASAYVAIIVTANEVFIKLLEELRQREEQIENERDRIINEQERQKLNEYRKQLTEEIKKMEEEKKIAKEIEKKVSGSSIKIISNLPRLIYLIYKSFILRENLKNPEESINLVKRKIRNLEERFNEL